MSAGWFVLAVMIAAYGIANFLQAIAAAREQDHCAFHPRLLVRLAAQRIYLAGIGFQMLGFILAIAARAELPLFLVQASVAAGLGVTAILGVLVAKWQLPRAEVMLLIGLGLGIAALIIAAQPSPPKDLGATMLMVLTISPAAIALAGFFATRHLYGVPGSVALGALAGLAFGAAAVASRPLANLNGTYAILTDPLLYLVIAQSLVGQLLLALAMQRGSTTAAVASMDAAFAVPPAVIGLLWLGDRVTPGLEWLAAIGFIVTLGSVLALTRYAAPQHHPVTAAQPTPRPRPANA